MRLDRFIANSSSPSSAASSSGSGLAELIEAGRIQVNGQPAAHGAQIIAATDTVQVDGEPLAARDFVYLLLNKPAGYVCSHRSEHHPTVIELLTTANFIGEAQEFARIPLGKLQIVGRLDLDTTGLILLTDDGEWNYRATAPEYRCTKTYRVSLKFPFAAPMAKRFEDGILLPGETEPTLPARVSALSGADLKPNPGSSNAVNPNTASPQSASPNEVSLQIAEGRYHQVKRMFAATENKVRSLHRQAVGSIELPPDLALGQFRSLTPAQIATI